MAHDLLPVLSDLPIQFIEDQVDRRVHVVRLFLALDDDSVGVDGNLCDMPVFFHMKNGLSVYRLNKGFKHLFKLFGNVISQGVTLLHVFE